jgi:hypothetical protein
MCLELHVGTDGGTKSDMIVDFAVHGKDDLPILTDQRLCARVYVRGQPRMTTTFLWPHTNTHNSQTFVNEDSFLADIAARPVRTTMALLL